MPKLVLLRHGQSEWNKAKRFTGWVDVELAEQGIQEAKEAGEALKADGYIFDKGYTSALKRAQETLKLCMETAGFDFPVERNEALNERHYGDLQGKNKDETRDEFGAEQVHIWRRSYDTPPPNGESLKDTEERVMPYYNEHIVPELRAGKNILIAAHGNSLRALIKNLEGLSGEEVTQVEVPTGKPKVYELDEDLNLVKTYYIN